MSTDDPATATLPPVQPQQYQVLCAVALGTISVILVQQGLVFIVALVLFLGTAAILRRVRISPLVILVVVVGGQLYQHYQTHGDRVHVALEIQDVTLCAAVLAYVGGHYRLLSLWRAILPLDPRQRYHRGAHTIVPLGRIGKIAPQHRPAGLLSRAELAWFVLQLPVFTLLAQGVWIALSVRRDVQQLPIRWLQFLQVAWGIAVVVFLAAQLFRFWRLVQIDPLTARVLLQEELWHETRGEQRRVGRWLAWWKRRRKED
jgi:hypothetical protein